jgi:hypothetical protein
LILVFNSQNGRPDEAGEGSVLNPTACRAAAPSGTNGAELDPCRSGYLSQAPLVECQSGGLSGIRYDPSFGENQRAPVTMAPAIFRE